MKIFLVKPNIKYKKSFQEYALSYKSIKDEHYFNKYKMSLDNFEGYVEELDMASREITKDNEVLVSAFWLICNEEVVGVVRVRHEEVDTAGHIGYDISPQYRERGFGTYILKLALVKAKEIGIGEAILTCNIDNGYSRKIIEKNDGKLLGRIYDEEEKEYLYRYSIKL